jgi:hypothetical protein
MKKILFLILLSTAAAADRPTRRGGSVWGGNASSGAGATGSADRSRAAFNGQRQERAASSRAERDGEPAAAGEKREPRRVRPSRLR